jgi:hypothetical protein
MVVSFVKLVFTLTLNGLIFIKSAKQLIGTLQGKLLHTLTARILSANAIKAFSKRKGP